ncbi:hypothetical protein QE152_g40300 [Popillia japonica]|uniref:Uncharacterized protein n=1 Tax=Popillia japonica TaxID=7064 RepID=A0AAW1HRX6_POPJA
MINVTRKQAAGEPFEKFYADLQNLIKTCEFNDQRDKLMKMQIIMRVSSKEIQENLLREERSLNKMVDHCMAVELAEKNMQVIATESQNQDLHVVRKAETSKSNYDKKKFKC